MEDKKDEQEEEKDESILLQEIEEEGSESMKVIMGEVYLGKVSRIMPFGAFVEILPGKEGLVHISKLDFERVNKVEDVVNVGDEILVKVTEIDSEGRINLSRKDALKDQKENKEKKN